jgi:hypothetical protein
MEVNVLTFSSHFNKFPNNFRLRISDTGKTLGAFPVEFWTAMNELVKALNRIIMDNVPRVAVGLNVLPAQLKCQMQCRNLE